MAMNTLVNHYKKDAILSAPPERLLLMLYDGALQNLNQSLKALERSDRAGFGMHLGKGEAIIAELLNTLDHQVGGAIAVNLEKLYLFIIDRLTQANLQRDAKGIHESIRILKTLKEGWVHAARQTAG